MIDALKRKLGYSQAPAEADTNKEEVTMSVTEASKDQAEMASLQESVTNLTAQLSTALSKVAELASVIETSKQLQAEKEAAALEAKLADRKLKVSEAVGTASADSVMTALAGLDDSSFATVLSAMTVTAKKESETKMFTETGVDGKTDVVKATAEAESNPVMDYLKSKYTPAAK